MGDKLNISFNKYLKIIQIDTFTSKIRKKLLNNMKKRLSKIKIINIKYIKNLSANLYLLIISILIIPTNLFSLTTIIKYKGIKSQRLMTCGTSDVCSRLPSYYYSKKLKEQTEHINNQLVYSAEIQWTNKLVLLIVCLVNVLILYQ